MAKPRSQYLPRTAAGSSNAVPQIQLLCPHWANEPLKSKLSVLPLFEKTTAPTESRLPGAEGGTEEQCEHSKSCRPFFHPRPAFFTESTPHRVQLRLAQLSCQICPFSSAILFPIACRIVQGRHLNVDEVSAKREHAAASSFSLSRSASASKIAPFSFSQVGS